MIDRNYIVRATPRASLRSYYLWLDGEAWTSNMLKAQHMTLAEATAETLTCDLDAMYLVEVVRLEPDS